ncbi:hypothetical protein L3Y34_015382 [Caenorhabditis briggsae]|uniref:RRM domain-containing protein n=2 Tax=Caenorhabditis briggsae TaxID=6238 RepID=A0AAE9IZL3_CAEBR|nr:hypothetical protein L3Y34_015382 [Caenorhabditis briggsae]
MSVIIRLKNLPMTAAAADVRTFFSGLKIPDGAVHIIGGDEGEVFVGFASDEDARLAMARDRAKIHGAEIRLFLSSKSEQSSVIAARKNASYASPEPHDQHVPSAFTHSAQFQQDWKPQHTGNPYAAKSGYEASYPPQNSNQIHLDFNSQNVYGNRKEISENRLQSPIKKEEPFDDDFGDYTHSFQPQVPQPQPKFDNRYGSGSTSIKLEEPVKPQAAPPAHLPIHSAQKPVPEIQYGIRGASINNGQNGIGFHESGNDQMSGGDSWRDNSFKKPAQNEYNAGYRGDYHEYQSYPETHKRDFHGGNKFNQAPARNVPPMNAQQPVVRPSQSMNGRKTLMPTPPAPFQNPPQPFAAPPSGGNNSQINRPFQNGLPPQNQLRNDTPVFRTNTAPPPIPNNINRQIPPAVQHPPPAFQNKIATPALVPAFNQAPVIPSANKLNGPANQTVEKFYIELTRLPMDLLRPAALEAFIHPTVPLTLSSVKTVFGPGGIHMHTIIRLDSIADYATMMRRNGEQGIKIQQSDKKSFEMAVDGAPLPIPVVQPVATMPIMQVNKKQDEDDNKKNKRSRWENKSPTRSPRRSPPRRDIRSRSRSPLRRRRRSRSPARISQHTDPTRWSVLVMNVPFRIKEEELMEWFAEKVRPAKLSRAYYSDGNASDRWIAEFSSESLMRRAFSIRTLCSGRTLRLTYVKNEEVDKMLKIEDVYGEEKRHKNEEARALQSEAEKINPPSFFNAPVTRGPPGGHMVPQGLPNSMNGLPPPQPNGFNGSVPPAGFSQPPPSGSFNGLTPHIRGGFVPRGNGFSQRGGPVGRGGHGGPGFYQNNGDSFNNAPEQSQQKGFGNQDGFRGSYRGGFRGGRGRGGGFQGNNHRSDEPQPSQNEFMQLVQSIGPRGTVLSCNGFPKDVTLEDVVDFFLPYEPDRNSIRIRRGDDGVMTGECMLACFGQEHARRASVDLDGQKLRNSLISVRLV